MLTTKHFEELAHIVRVNRRGLDPQKDKVTLITLRDVTEDLSAFCSRQNPNFDRARFFKACEV